MKTVVVPNNVYCYVRESFFTDNLNHKENFLKCKIVSVSGYVNEQLTFDLLVEDSYLYHNVPIIELNTSKKDYDDVCNRIKYKSRYGNYICNEQNSLEVIVYPYNEQNVYANVELSVDGYESLIGQYMFSVDMVKDNNIFHLIKLDCGGFVWVPSHKLSFSSKPLPTNWVKNRKYVSK